MKSVSELSFPEECRYTAEHVWIKADGDSFLVGITDYAQDQLGEVAYVELPDVDAHFDAQAEFGTVESIKSVNQLYMPVSGTVLEVNGELEDAPTMINVGAYSAGWMIRIAPDNVADIDALLTAAAYTSGL